MLDLIFMESCHTDAEKLPGILNTQLNQRILQIPPTPVENPKCCLIYSANSMGPIWARAHRAQAQGDGGGDGDGDGGGGTLPARPAPSQHA